MCTSESRDARKNFQTGSELMLTRVCLSDPSDVLSVLSLSTGHYLRLAELWFILKAQRVPSSHHTATLSSQSSPGVSPSPPHLLSGLSCGLGQGRLAVISINPVLDGDLPVLTAEVEVGKKW